MTRSSGRPGHLSAAKQVNVDVINGLAPIRSGVDYSSISLRESFGPSDFRSSPLKMTEKFPLLFLRMGDGCDMFTRNDEDVHGGLRLHVGKGVAMLILVDSLGRDAPIDDLAEDATHEEESTGQV